MTTTVDFVVSQQDESPIPLATRGSPCGALWRIWTQQREGRRAGMRIDRLANGSAHASTCLLQDDAAPFPCNRENRETANTAPRHAAHDNNTIIRIHTSERSKIVQLHGTDRFPHRRLDLAWAHMYTNSHQAPRAMRERRMHKRPSVKRSAHKRRQANLFNSTAVEYTVQ
jgi:hypothetical protein